MEYVMFPGTTRFQEPTIIAINDRYRISEAPDGWVVERREPCEPDDAWDPVAEFDNLHASLDWFEQRGLREVAGEAVTKFTVGIMLDVANLGPTW